MPRCTGFLAFLIFSSPLFLRAAKSIVLGVSNTNNFTTQIQIVNPGTQTANLTFNFIATDGQTSVPPAAQMLAPGATLVLNDVLNSLWTLTTQTGAVVVSYDQFTVISATKSSVAANGGLIGTALPVSAEETMLEAYSTGEIVWISQSSAFNTNLFFYLDAPNTSALLTLYDNAGNTVGQTTVAGGPGYVTLPVSTLVTGDLPIGSAMLFVQSGRISCYSEITDTASGDLMASRLAGPNDVGGILSLDGVLRQTTPDGALMATDVRIVNMSSAAAMVTVILGAAYAQNNVAAGATLELQDVLGHSLNVADAGGGTLLITSTATLAAAGRLNRPNSAGGTLSAIQVASVVPPGVAGGQMGIISGLRSTQSSSTSIVSGGPLTGSGGADLSLADSTGGPLASAPGALQLGPSVSRVDALPSLFQSMVNAGSIPDAASLFAGGTGGGLSLGAVSVDQASGDPTYLKVDNVQPYLCSPPAFTDSSITPVTLDQPGNAQLSWSTKLANSVDISTGLTGQAASGSAGVTVGGSTTIVLTAHNSCGDTNATVNVFVGPPQAVSVANFFNPSALVPASGMPGELVAVQLANLADPTTATAVLLTGADGQTIGADAVDSTNDGRVLVRVPLWPDGSTQGYRTGAFTLSAMIAGSAIGSIPFTINPLAYVGDPIAGFGALLDRLSGDGSTVATAVAGVQGYAHAGPAQQQAAATVEALLRQMLSAIAASGSAKIPTDFDPQGASAAVALSDLTTFMAYVTNVGIPYPTATPNTAGTPSNCLRALKPLVGACTTLESARNLELLTSLFLSVKTPNDLASLPSADQLDAFLQSEFVTTPIGAVARLMVAWYHYLDYACMVSPVRLNTFAISSPAPRPDRVSSPLNVTANLVAYAPANLLAGQFESNTLLSVLDQYCVNCSATDRPQIAGLLRLDLDTQNTTFNQQLTTLAGTLNAAPQPTDSATVGSCDLQNFYPLTNGPLNDPQSALYGHTAILAPDPSAPGYGDPSYFYYVVGSGTETGCIVPYTHNFVLPLTFDRTTSSAFSPCSSPSQTVSPAFRPKDLIPAGYYVPWSYVAEQPDFQGMLQSYNVNAYLAGTDGNSLQTVTEDVLLIKPPEHKATDGIANADIQSDTVNVNRDDGKTSSTEITLEASSVLVIKTLPGFPPQQEMFPHLADAFASFAFSRTPHPGWYGEITVTLKTQPGCPFYTYSISGADESGFPIPLVTGQDSDPQPLTIQKGAAARVSVSLMAHGGNTARCKATVTVGMTDQYPTLSYAPPAVP